MEESLLRALVGVIFVWSLRNFVGYFLRITLVSIKRYVEGIIFGLKLGDADGSPLRSSVGCNDYFIVGRELRLSVGKILG